MAKQTYKERLLAGASGTMEPPNGHDAAQPRAAPNNAQKRDAAHAHLDKMLDEAEGEQIGGRAFFGFVEIHVEYQDGFAQEVRASRFARDRVDMRPKF